MTTFRNNSLSIFLSVTVQKLSDHGDVIPFYTCMCIIHNLAERINHVTARCSCLVPMTDEPSLSIFIANAYRLLSRGINDRQSFPSRRTLQHCWRITGLSAEHGTLYCDTGGFGLTEFSVCFSRPKAPFTPSASRRRASMRLHLAYAYSSSCQVSTSFSVTSLHCQ